MTQPAPAVSRREHEEGNAKRALVQANGGEAADEDDEPGRHREHRGAQRALERVAGHGSLLPSSPRHGNDSAGQVPDLRSRAASGSGCQGSDPA
jgi:hypothetical protein